MYFEFLYGNINDMIFYIFQRLCHIQHTKDFFVYLQASQNKNHPKKLKEVFPNISLNLNFNKNIQTKPNDKFDFFIFFIFYFIYFISDWVNPIGLIRFDGLDRVDSVGFTRLSLLKNKPIEETKTKTYQMSQKHKN